MAAPRFHCGTCLDRHPRPDGLRPVSLLLLSLLLSATRLYAAAPTSTNTPPAAPGTVLLEAAGTVQIIIDRKTEWTRARVGDRLQPGDRLRTLARSRATLQLSDRSIVRVDQLTTLEIQEPTRPAAKRRFRLPLGSIFFFDREKPADVEFETPLATGAIRGTEFLLEAPNDGTTRLDVFDGAVELTTARGDLSVVSGEEGVVTTDAPPRKTALVEAINRIQWALYYPAVVDPADLHLEDRDRLEAAGSLEAYQAGDLPTALSRLPDALPSESKGLLLFRSALLLSVGRVDEADRLLATIPLEHPARRALEELVAAVQFRELKVLPTPTTGSEWLARSYYLQSRADLDAALASARQAARKSPKFGFAHARLAELEFSFGHRRKALRTLDLAGQISPALPVTQVLRGFHWLDRHDPMRARAAFEAALSLDPALGNAWLGRGLALIALSQREQGEQALLTASALEPQRSLFRSYLGKAYADRRATGHADREFNLAQKLDPADPTSYLYRALHEEQENRPNEAIRDLERARVLNDQRALFRSRLLLDEDLAVKSADLAAIYDDAGLLEASRHAAATSVEDDYSGFSGHLFLSRAYGYQADPNLRDLRLESARHSERLLANLLAPPGGGNLSSLLSQQDHLQFFNPRPFGASSSTTYASDGDWTQQATAFGHSDGLSFALDAQYRSLQGAWPNQDLEDLYLSAQIKQQVTPDDGVYVEVGYLDLQSGDVARYYSPTEVHTGLRVEERQRPFLYAGWNHEWNPGSHTLFLAARLQDQLRLTDPQPNLPFLFQSGGSPAGVGTASFVDLDLERTFTLYSAELQHIWQSANHTVIAGGRFQGGDAETHSVLGRTLTGTVADQQSDPSLVRANAYAYEHWQIVDSLRLIVGLSYDHLEYPDNVDQPPISDRTRTRELLAPKVGLAWSPWQQTTLRAAYSQTLGGLYFDNSVRLEPAQLVGFTQAYRSLIPESVESVVPGTRFEIVQAAIDHAFASGTYLGLEAQWLQSDADLTLGVLTNSTPFPIPDSPSSTRQSLDYLERNLAVYAQQLLGRHASVGARYTFSQADLTGRFPGIPSAIPGADTLHQDETARLHQVGLNARYLLPFGPYAEWQSYWLHQESLGYSPSRSDEDLWQHNLFVGYRLPGHRAELRLGLLNLTDADYRLSPLNLHPALPRERTLTVSLRLNF